MQELELCQICNREGEDRRTLRLQYTYDLSEISDKFVKEELAVRFPDGRELKNVFWTVNTCKDCRGNFLVLLRTWVNGNFFATTDNDPDRNIPVRVDGRMIMMTTQEYEHHSTQQGYPYRRPIRLTQQDVS